MTPLLTLFLIAGLLDVHAVTAVMGPVAIVAVLPGLPLARSGGGDPAVEVPIGNCLLRARCQLEVLFNRGGHAARHHALPFPTGCDGCLKGIGHEQGLDDRAGHRTRC